MIVIIHGSYRDEGVIDQCLAIDRAELERAGATVAQVDLRNYPVEFCHN
ncbi:hypothetical protein [Halioxenophilus sp. WMMB6]|nr:hypothetical protein [Halioxenophilus sp. WMMB6]